jgi:hypothetical protein
MAFGFFKILEKSAGTKLIPIPNIIMARDNGKNSLLIISVIVIG